MYSKPGGTALGGSFSTDCAVWLDDARRWEALEMEFVVLNVDMHDRLGSCRTVDVERPTAVSTRYFRHLRQV